jgi:hypothetical protein
MIKTRVYRLVLASAGGELSVIAKRMGPRTAEGNRLLAERWLPAVGLAEIGPPLIATLADGDGRWLWQLYTDLGERSLADVPGADSLPACEVAEIVAEVHARFTHHPLLPECRIALGDRGAHFLEVNVRDALVGVERILAVRGLESERSELAERLTGRMRTLLAELPERREALERWGGPETLVHGDPWPTNAFALETGARLIDWDRAGVGPAAYDLSTLLLRLDEAERGPALDAYRGVLERHGLDLELGPGIELAFDSAEQARMATRVVWPAVSVATGEATEWGWDELAAVDEWLQTQVPVLT